jgi:glycerophosphoryl diester phosphodiesterase
MTGFRDGLRPTLLIPHRFGAQDWPEGTQLALDESIRSCRPQVQEMDVQSTRDGQLVVLHNPTVDDYTEATGRVSDFTLAQLKQLDFGYRFTRDGGKTYPYRGQGLGILTPEQVLSSHPEMRFNIELKPESGAAADTFVQMLRKENAVDRCCIGSADDTVSQALVQLLPNATHFAPFGATLGWFLAMRSGSGAKNERPSLAPYTVLDVPYRIDPAELPPEASAFAGQTLVDEAFLKAAREDGLWVNVWTVNEEADMRALIQANVGGIITDRPRRLRALLDSI